MCTSLVLVALIIQSMVVALRPSLRRIFSKTKQISLSPPPRFMSSANGLLSNNLERISALRKEYSMKGLDEASMPADPLTLFGEWFEDAKTVSVEPNAMCLSTASKEGRPSARFVLLKGYDERGFVFYTNYESRKGKELTENPFASLTFWWEALERSIRIEGRVQQVPPEESDAYFTSRPKASRLGAIASDQSRPIASREALEAKWSELEGRYEGTAEVPRPLHWGGFRLVPSRIEFWKGRESRLHDRLVYTRGEGEGEGGGEWRIERMQP
ncbi:unnamed protein product [Vitrella brassicaformis CCMP3155]|uniref:pyridoxal 5'-phosphate synthase n=2 Tax=Vitrella brassicaformis TaxID=1169539 RepID=A0A0G4EI35_VITBC|nr:unnamed protein product [Vitrella brassicaformis CCMP3155]|eukprot:CEL95653.1 unnamed protein product [Vitrella brassicaformis CCMP3155]